MKKCEDCEKVKMKEAYMSDGDIYCRLCRATRNVAKAKRMASKEYVPIKPIQEFEQVLVFSKQMYSIFTMSQSRFMEVVHGRYLYKIVEEGEVYLCEYMDEFKEDLYTKALILERDNFKCQYCGEIGNTIDHLYPRSRGGADNYVNYLTCCQKCNATKKDIILKNIFEMKYPQRLAQRGNREIDQEYVPNWVERQKMKEKSEVVREPTFEEMLSNALKKRW